MDRRKILLVVAVLVAALGAGLVFIYAQGAEDRAAEKVTTTTVIVATAQIEAGESAADAAKNGKLDSRDVESSSLIEGATNDGTLFEGLVALTTIYPGEQLILSKFGTSSDVAPPPLVAPPEGKGSMQLTIEDPNHVGSFLQAGSHVAIFQAPCVKPSIYDEETLNRYDAGRARVVLPDALVLGVGDTTVGQATAVDANGAPVATSPSTSITIAVDQEEATILGGLGYPQVAPLFFVLKDDNTKITAEPDLDPAVDPCAPSGS